jgi:dipeptidyl aminopeptidase/acylaminoacyl peptidase
MRPPLILCLALIALSWSLAAQAKHPFTFEDMMKLKRVGDPQVSPDGKWVIFSVVDVDLAANTKTPHIWIVPLNADVGTAAPGRPAERSSAGSSSAERILIADQHGDRPRWAPDGKRFAFLSTKERGSQVWIADFDGARGMVSTIHKLTSIATEASGELWSPDGKNILFTSDVYPECDGAPEAEANCNAKKLDEHEKSEVKALIFDHLLYRHWNAYKEGKRTHIFVASACVGTAAPGCPAGAARDLTPGDYDAPVFSLGGQDDYAFSPDGKEICYASNHDKNPAASTNNDLWIVPVNVGADASSAPRSEATRAATDADWVKTVLAHTKNITADNPASDTSPLYSPDGRYIAYRAQQRPGYESDRFRLMLYDRKTGEKKNLTETVGKQSPGSLALTADLWVGTFVWTPDSESILFVAEESGATAIWKVGVKEHNLPAADSVALPVGAGPKELGVPATISGVIKSVGKDALFPITHSQGGYDDDLAVTPDGKQVLFTRMSIYAPIEIYSRVVAEEKWPPVARQITHMNDEVLSRVAMSELNFFLFKGANNDRAQGFLIKPPNFDPSKKYPVKFLIHGGPQGAWGDDWSYRWNPELFAANGYVVIMINFHGSTGYGQKFIDAINGDWGGAPFEDLMKGLDYAEQTYPFIDRNRECALGASYGGYMANWILGHTDRFKCIVSHDGMFNAESAWGSTEEMWFNNWEFKGTPYDNRAMYQKWSPHQYAKNFKTPTLVIHGQRDYRLDVSEGFQLFTTLQMEGIPSKMLYFPDEGHWVLKPQNSQLWYKTVNDWVDQWIGK